MGGNGQIKILIVLIIEKVFVKRISLGFGWKVEE